MQIEETGLSGALILTPRRFGDARGFFSESWNKNRMRDAGLDYDFVQDNHSFSMARGTLRGLHYQSPPHAQAKLVRCGRGALWDVVVDIRQGSPTYGQWVGVELSFANGRQVMVPEGFLHGFVTLEPETEVVYKCTDHYAPDCDGTVAWNDSDIGIDWPISTVPVLSDKDAFAPRLADIANPFHWTPA